MENKHFSGTSDTPVHLEWVTAKTRQIKSLVFTRECYLGSGADNDLTINDEGVLTRHARIFLAEDGAVFIEATTDDAAVVVNGLSSDKPLLVRSNDWVVLGSTPFQIRLNISQPDSAPKYEEHPKPSAQANVTDLSDKSVVTIGRLPQSDVSIPSPLISRLHARLIREATGWYIEDCGSTNGTFINAVRVQGRQPVHADDWLAFAAFEYEFDGQRIFPSDKTGQVEIEVHGLTKEVRDQSGRTKRLLDNISFAIEPGEFVGIFGTSGSGKSTLLDALGNCYFKIEWPVRLNMKSVQW